MLHQVAFKSHSVRKWTPIFRKSASLESTDKHKGHLADHFVSEFHKLSSIHFPKPPRNLK